jgi:hypothetical protein
MLIQLATCEWGLSKLITCVAHTGSGSVEATEAKATSYTTEMDGVRDNYTKAHVPHTLRKKLATCNSSAAVSCRNFDIVASTGDVAASTCDLVAGLIVANTFVNSSDAEHTVDRLSAVASLPADASSLLLPPPALLLLYCSASLNQAATAAIKSLDSPRVDAAYWNCFW